MKKIAIGILAICAFSFSRLFADDYGRLTPAQRHRVEIIDSRLQSLEDLKEYYVARAARLRNRGDRIQFDDRGASIEEAQKNWQSADGYVKIADQIQEQIEDLQKERAKLMRKV